MTTIYELSGFTERLFILIQLLIALGFIVGIAFFGLKHLIGKAKLLILVPISYLIFVCNSHYQDFDTVTKYENILASNSYSSFKGKLIKVTQKDEYNYYQDSPRSAGLATVIGTSTGTLKSVEPKHSSIGDIGCFTNTLVSELEEYVGKDIFLAYVNRAVENRNSPLLCVLKIEVTKG
jgi:hypothetical protein